MLGKGLESLIPKKNGQPPPGDTTPGVSAVPAGDNGAAARAGAALSGNSGISESEMPVGHDEPLMLFTQDEKELPAGEDMLLADKEAAPEISEPRDSREASKPDNGDATRVAKEPDVLNENDASQKTDKPSPGPGRTAWLPSREAKEAPIQPAQSGKAVHRPYEAVFHIEVGKIKPNSHQPRKIFDPDSLRELAHSIREFGILQPLVVTKKEIEVPTGTDVEYELIAGERRLEAAKLLGLERVPAVIKNVDLERERLEMAIIENLQRENLSPVEMARAFSRLQDEFRLTQREIASRLGKSREAIANTMRLLDLPPHIQEAIDRKQITESHGRLLLSITDQAAQERLFKDLLGQKMTTREFKRRVENAREKIQPHEKADPEFEIIQEKLSSELGAPVKISASGDTGKITISFYSKEELDSILEKLKTGE